MKKYLFTKAEFIKTAVKEKDWPKIRDLSGDIVPEIAVAGRSNVGKSSLLNHLFKSKDLVKTSSVPGKTQALNFFQLNKQLAFCDLPGYGFAKVPDSIKKQWGPMIQTYLEKREELKLILFLLDIRRQPNEDDIKFLHWAAHAGKSVIVVITKIDKVTPQECRTNTKHIEESFPFENLHFLHYSVPLNKGRDKLIGLIHEALLSEEIEEEEQVDGHH
jgi:GTP-binding protein